MVPVMITLSENDLIPLLSLLPPIMLHHVLTELTGCSYLSEAETKVTEMTETATMKTMEMMEMTEIAVTEMREMAIVRIRT
jgi:hypothetical protein